MENDVNSKEMLCNKISEIRKKFFFTIAGLGEEQNKNENFFELYITQAFFAEIIYVCNLQKKSLINIIDV